MVKISLKKESRVKKQKQKQKQSQKVVVNIGTNVLKPKRRRKATGPIEKKGINKQQPSTVYIPQSLPVLQSSQPPNSMSEFVKYLKESEKQKEVAQEKEKRKSNELEKEKKEEKRSEVLTRDEVQDNFSTVYPSSNISSLTSGTSTPLLSRPVDHNSLFEALSREADLRSENPNSGSISLSTSDSNPLSSSVSSTSFISNDSSKQTLDDILQNTVVTAVEDPVIDQVLEELPENQIVIYGSQRAGQTSTATEQITNPIDNSIPPPLPFRINKPLPTVRMADIIAANTKPLSLTQISQKEIEREARLKALEPKKPDIEPEIPTFSKEDLDQYKEQPQKATKQGLKDFELKLDNMTNLELGKLLKDNGIKGQSGNDFRFTTNKQVYDGKTFIAKDALKKNLLIAFENGYLTNI